MANDKLGMAKKAKNDEFYTQYQDIEKEVNAYLDYDANVFRNKTVLLPCDDPEWSNFTKYFAQNFEKFGLKKLISTSYAPNRKRVKKLDPPTLFETESPQYDATKANENGKIFTLTHDKNGDNRVNVDDLEWEYLKGDGDFNSEEIIKLRDEADIIITNPPFSLFREFLAWVIESKKLFLIIGNKNCVTYKWVFPLIREGKMWSGRTEWSGGLWFETKDPDDVDRVVDGVNMKNVSSVWFTNIDHGRRHQPLPLMSMEDNLRFSKHKDIRGKSSYEKYDNYDAIEVPYTDAIPNDYSGLMGVPISFLDKYNPDQFEILGITKTWDDASGLKTKIYPTQVQMSRNGKTSQVTKLNDGAVLVINEPTETTYYKVGDQMLIQVYARILIRNRELSR